MVKGEHLLAPGTSMHPPLGDSKSGMDARIRDVGAASAAEGAPETTVVSCVSQPGLQLATYSEDATDGGSVKLLGLGVLIGRAGIVWVTLEEEGDHCLGHTRWRGGLDRGVATVWTRDGLGHWIAWEEGCGVSRKRLKGAVCEQGG